MRLARMAAVGLLAALAGQPAVAGSAGRCGGTGGTHSKTLTCPSGHYIASIAARGGAFVDLFSIACRKIPSAGEPGSLGDSKSAGPGGGTVNGSGNCKTKKQAVTGLWFKSGAFIDNVQSGLCSKRTSDGWAEDADFVLQINIGGIGGGLCDLICPVGEAMHSVKVKYGGVIDSISAECRR